MEEKVCYTCQKSKPIEDFYITKDGYTVRECSECKKEYHRQYRAKNKDYLKERKLDPNVLKKAKLDVFKPGKCSKRECDEPRVSFEGVFKFCKSHAYDYIFSIYDV